jgi:hypothetical protein
MGQISPTYHFSKKTKQRDKIKMIPHLACILGPKNSPTTKTKEKKYCGRERAIASYQTFGFGV